MCQPKELYEIFGQSGAVILEHMLEVRTAGIEGAPAKIIYPMLADRHPQIGLEGGLSGYLAKKQAALAEARAAADPSLIFTAEPDKGHAHALDHFIDEINGDGPQICGVDDAVLAIRVAFAAIKSAADQRVVRMEEI